MGFGSSKPAQPPPPPPPSKAPPPPPQPQETGPPPPPPPPPAPVYGTYTPFTEFPTIELLAKAQKDYLAANVEHKLDPDGIPFPFPPPTLKSEVFRLEDYEDIDDHALKTPLSMATTTYDALASHLILAAKNDIGKVRAMFVWIAGQGVQQINSYLNNNHPTLDNNSPLFLLANILINRRAGSYSQLLANLCNAAKIPVRIVTNVQAKGMSYRVGDDEINTSNSHCIVYVDKAWRIIDQHWGSQSVIAQADSDWTLIAGQRTLKNKQQDELQYVYRRDEEHFLTDPERFIVTRWCPAEEEQLLARPITKKEFLEIAFLKTGFFDLGLTSTSQTKCKVTTKNGTAVIKFGLPATSKLTFEFSLYRSTKVDKHNVIEGTAISKYVIMERNLATKELIVTINMKAYGKHKFELRGKIEGEYSSQELCEYLLFAQEPNFIAEPFPSAPSDIFGVSASVEELGLEADAKLAGIITAENGIAVVRFRRTTKTVTQFRHILMTEDVNGNTELRHYVRHYYTESEVVFVVHLPSHGQYVLSASAKQTGESRETHVCQYLIKSDRGCVDGAFPKSNTVSDEIGNIIKDEDEQLIFPVSHPEPLIDWQDKGELVIGMKVLKEAKFLGELWWCSTDNNEVNYSEFLLVEKDDRQITFNIKFARIGRYKLNIKASSAIIYQYIIIVRSVSEDSVPFPQQLNNWKSEFRLFSPRTKNVSLNETLHFKLRIPSVNAVKVVCPSRGSGEISTGLQQSTVEQDVWEGDVNSGAIEGSLSVFYEPLNTPNIYTQILLFKVDADENSRKLKNAKVAALNEANTVDAQRRAKEQSEAEEAARRQREREEKARQKREDFIRNFEKYKNEEIKIQKEEEILIKAEINEGFSSDTVDEGLTQDDLIAQRDIAKLEAEKKLPEWQQHYDKMKCDLAYVRLKEAVASRDREKLAQAIDDCQCFPSKDHENELRHAEKMLEILDARNGLNIAMRSKDCEAIRDAIDYMIDNGLEHKFEPEIKQAEQRIKIIEKMNGVKCKVLGMNRTTMMELRSYKEPPEMVHTLMRACFLLLGEDESLTQDWQYCQRLCRSQGDSNLLNRIANYDASALHEEIEARCREMLETVDLKEVQDISVGVATFYIWSMGILDDAQSGRQNGETGDSYSYHSVKPANVERQREIFGTSNLMKSLSLRHTRKEYNNNF